MTLQYSPFDPTKTYDTGTWVLRVKTGIAITHPMHQLIIRPHMDASDLLTTIQDPHCPPRLRESAQLAPLPDYDALPAIDLLTHPIPAHIAMRFVGRFPDGAAYMLYVHDLLGERVYNYIDEDTCISAPEELIAELPTFRGIALRA